jgi:hypothetical protein
VTSATAILSARRFIAVACAFIAMVIAVNLVVDGALDPAVQVQQTDLYRQDFFAVPLADDASATQSLRGNSIVRIDVLAQSRELGRLRLQVRDADGNLLRRETVPVPPTKTPEWVVFTFPVLEVGGDVLARFDAPDDDTTLQVFGSTCDCLADGELAFDNGTGDAMPTLKDLHVGSYALANARERFDLLSDRIGAYAPGWFAWQVGAVLGIVALIAAAFLVGSSIVTATRAARTPVFAASVAAATVIPVLLVWIGVPG